MIVLHYLSFDEKQLDDLVRNIGSKQYDVLFH